MVCEECGCEFEVPDLYVFNKALFDKINEGFYIPTELEEAVYLEKICNDCFQKLSS